MTLCSCPRDRLCAACIEQSVTWLTGPAQLRGERWARELVGRVPRDRAWNDAKLRTIARHRLADLSADERLLDRLTELFVMRARKWWLAAAGDSQGRSGCVPAHAGS